MKSTSLLSKLYNFDYRRIPFFIKWKYEALRMISYRFTYETLRRHDFFCGFNEILGIFAAPSVTRSRSSMHLAASKSTKCLSRPFWIRRTSVSRSLRINSLGFHGLQQLNEITITFKGTTVATATNCSTTHPGINELTSDGIFAQNSVASVSDSSS